MKLHKAGLYSIIFVAKLERYVKFYEFLVFVIRAILSTVITK